MTKQEDASDGVDMPRVILSQLEINTLAAACQVAVNEHLQFLDYDVRLNLAQALYAMNKPGEAVSIQPDQRRIASDERH